MRYRPLRARSSTRRARIGGDPLVNVLKAIDLDLAVEELKGKRNCRPSVEHAKEIANRHLRTDADKQLASHRLVSADGHLDPEAVTVSPLNRLGNSTSNFPGAVKGQNFRVGNIARGNRPTSSSRRSCDAPHRRL